MDQPLLPAGFESLAHLQPEWGLPTIEGRRQRRERASMAEINGFYEEMLALAPAAMKHLEAFPIAEMPAPEARLYELVLMLAHVSMATELHRQPRAPHTPYPHGVKLVKAPPLFG